MEWWRQDVLIQINVYRIVCSIEKWNNHIWHNEMESVCHFMQIAFVDGGDGIITGVIVVAGGLFQVFMVIQLSWGCFFMRFYFFYLLCYRCSTTMNIIRIHMQNVYVDIVAILISHQQSKQTHLCKKVSLNI